MLNYRRRICTLYVRESMGPAKRAYQEGIALGMVPGALSSRIDPYKAPVAILASTGRNALGDDSTAGITPDMNHLRTRISLLKVIGHRNRIKLRRRIITLKDGRRVFPCNGGPSLNLSPAEVTSSAAAYTPFRNQIEDTSLPLSIAGIPVLHRRVTDICILFNYDLDDGGMELLLIPHRSGTTLHIAHIGTFISDDEGPLKLAGPTGVDSEIAGKVHRAAHSLRNVTK